MRPRYWPTQAWFRMPRGVRRVVLKQRAPLAQGPSSYVRDVFAIRSTWAEKIGRHLN